MITTSKHNPWPLDTEIQDLKSAGLTKESLVRFKFFNLDHRLMLDTIGTLSKEDQKIVLQRLKELFLLK
jgi:mRNA interferase MazF